MDCKIFVVPQLVEVMCSEIDQHKKNTMLKIKRKACRENQAATNDYREKLSS